MASRDPVSRQLEWEQRYNLKAGTALWHVGIFTTTTSLVYDTSEHIIYCIIIYAENHRFLRAS